MAEKDNGTQSDLTEDEIKALFEGGRGTLPDLQNDDGILAKQASKQNTQSSVLQRAMNPTGNDDYRQLLILGMDPKRANLAVKALAECRRVFADITPIVDQMHADAGAYTGNRLAGIFNALTHSTYTVQNKVNNRKVRAPWYNRDDRTGSTNFEE